MLMLACCLFSSHLQAFYDPYTSAAAISPQDELERRLWDESALLRPQMLQRAKASNETVLNAALQATLVRHFPSASQAIRVYVFDEQEMAALSTANGDIYLSTGLLSRLDNDDELSVILAREIAHVVNRDAARNIVYDKTFAGVKETVSTALSAYNLAASFANPNKLLNSLPAPGADTLLKSLSPQGAAALGKTSAYGYSDRLENEADVFALQYVLKRKGNTEIFQRVFKRLHEQAAADEKPKLNFYSNVQRMKDRLDFVGSWAGNPSAEIPFIAQEMTLLGVIDAGAEQKEKEAALSAALLQSVWEQVSEREAYEGSPSRFLLNLARKQSAPMQAPNTDRLKGIALLRKPDPQDRDAGLALLKQYASTYPSDWKTSRLIAREHEQRKEFTNAAVYWEQALAGASDEKDKIFLNEQYARNQRRVSKYKTVTSE